MMIVVVTFSKAVLQFPAGVAAAVAAAGGAVVP